MELDHEREWELVQQPTGESIVTPVVSADLELRNDLPSVTHRFPRKTDKINYSFANTAKDEDGNIIRFDNMQTNIMNCLDNCLNTGDNNISIDIFIRRLYAQKTYKPSDEDRKQIMTYLINLSLMSGVCVIQKDDNIEIFIGALIPIRLNVEMKVGGQYIKDGITIMGHTCIYGRETHNIEYWRLQFPNNRMRKTERNIIISRKVLENYIKGESVDVSELCEIFGAETPRERQRLVETVLQCVNYQRQSELPAPAYYYENDSDEGGKVGRPRIKAIGTN